MSRPIGVWIFATLFVIWGLQGIGTVLSGAADPAIRLPKLAIALLVLATGAGLFRARSWTLRVYVVWVALAMVTGLAGELTGGRPVLVVVVWGVLMSAVYVSVGFYLRGQVEDAS